jgi:hypothetical protein
VQINLAQHPNAFRSLDEAFDPDINTRYGAAFLTRLFAMTRDWGKAAAFYHSATPALGAEYERKVIAALSGRHSAAFLVTTKRSLQPLPLLPTPQQQLAAAWAATLDEGTDSSDTTPAAVSASVVPPPSPSRAEQRGASSRFARNVTAVAGERNLLR